jgi:hypothetical protein
VIGADNITLNLNGHTIDGIRSVPPEPSTGVDNRRGYDGATIKRGTVREFGASIRLENARQNTVRAVTIVGDEISFIDPSGILNTVHIGGVGLRDSTANRIVRNKLLDAGIGLGGSTHNLVAGNVVSDGSIGLGDTSWEGHSTNNLIQGNRISGGAIRLSGFFYPPGPANNWIVRNSISNGGFGGISITEADGNWLGHNTISLSDIGLYLRESNYGVTTIVKNRAVANREDGFQIYPLSRTVLKKNVAAQNGDDGIEISPQGAARFATVAGNIATGNGDLGIEAPLGVVDGGGNRASGNGNPLQCLNVFCR